jgi:hypothetical protein
MTRKRDKAARTPAKRRVLLHFARVLLTLVVFSAGIITLVWFGSHAGNQIAGHPRYTIRFTDIECDAPPGTTRETFLSEVRYLGNIPATIQVVDAGLPDELSTLFQKHPWVEKVQGVEVTAERVVRVQLRFRTPVLLVRMTGSNPQQRLVDAKGVLLPPAPPPDGVAVLVNEQPPPTVLTGQVWDGPVKRAAELVVEFDAVRVERTSQGDWRVTQKNGRVLRVSW